MDFFEKYEVRILLYGGYILSGGGGESVAKLSMWYLYNTVQVYLYSIKIIWWHVIKIFPDEKCWKNVGCMKW